MSNCKGKCKCSMFGSYSCDQVWTNFIENNIKKQKRLEKDENSSISKKLTKMSRK